MTPEALFEACQACVEHARHLLESAKLVQNSGRQNIAYHLATLALEEMGRREILQIREMADRSGEAPAWQSKATQDHTKKLFWCLYGIGQISDVSDQKLFLEKREAAADIHAIRLSGLYVESTDSGLNVPSEAISAKQSDALIRLAEAVVSVGESAKPRDVSKEEIELQSWLLNAFDNPELRKWLLNKASIESLRASNDVAAWARKVRSDIETSNAELQKLLETEMRKAPNSLGRGNKERWKIQFKLRTAANTIRAKPLKKWNEKVKWIKFYPQQGALSKEELIAEITLGDNFPIASLQSVATSFSIQLVMALNLATSGFWWWPLPPNQQRVYERIRDLENNLDLKVEDRSFEVFTSDAPLTDVHMDNLAQCFAALPDPKEKRTEAYQHYLGGLTFIALNCVQLRSEDQAFANFVRSFRLFMEDANFLEKDESTDHAAGRFIDEKFPELDPPERESLLSLIRALHQRPQTSFSAKLGDVYFMKLLCETIFRDSLMLPALRKRSEEPDRQEASGLSES
jgi:AbiV family abortive infection protein